MNCNDTIGFVYRPCPEVIHVPARGRVVVSTNFYKLQPIVHRIEVPRQFKQWDMWLLWLVVSKTPEYQEALKKQRAERAALTANESGNVPAPDGQE